MSIPAERALLGALIIDPEAIKRVRGIVRPEHFYRRGLQAIYRCMLAVDDSGMALDFVTLCEEIEWSGALDPWTKGWKRWYATVAGLANWAPTSLHVDDYASLVVRAADDRKKRVERSWLAQ